MTTPESFFDHICLNYKTNLDKTLYIGYSNTRIPFIVIPLFAFLMNICLIFTNLRQKYLLK